MNQRDKSILIKITDYCLEIKDTHDYFKQDKELSKMLSVEFLNEYTKIPWKMIMRMRDIVAHHYGSLDYEIVWNTSVSDIPELYLGIKEILII